MRREIAPRSGAAFTLKAGDLLSVLDPQGEQVADLVAFNAADPREWISSGRTLDYLGRFLIGEGDPLYSNRSNVMLRIVKDMVGRHDFLLAPCSAEMFKLLYHEAEPHRGCFGNLAAALADHGVTPDQIPVAFNVFMNVEVDGESGALAVRPPLSRPGDYVTFRAEMDLIIGLTACAAGQSNNFRFKPIEYDIASGG